MDFRTELVHYTQCFAGRVTLAGTLSILQSRAFETSAVSNKRIIRLAVLSPGRSGLLQCTAVRSKQFYTVSKPRSRVHDVGSYTVARKPPDSIFNNRNSDIGDLFGHESSFFGKDTMYLVSDRQHCIPTGESIRIWDVGNNSINSALNQTSICRWKEVYHLNV